MTGNTDTRYYWNLSQHIYRFTPADRNGNLGIHTVDEHLLFDDHISGEFFFCSLYRRLLMNMSLQGIWFFHELLRNADEASF